MDEYNDFEDFKRAELENDYAYDLALADSYDPREDIKEKIRGDLEESLTEYIYYGSNETINNIQRIWSQLENLHQQQHFSAVVVFGVTIYEIYIRELVRALIKSIFFDDELSDLVTGALFDQSKNAKIRKEKELFPIFLKQFGLDLNSEKLGNGATFKEIFGHLWEERHDAIHRGKKITKKNSELMMECIKKLMEYHSLLVEKANLKMKTSD